MKRLFLFFLSLLLILCGCKQETEKSLRLTGNHRKDPYQVNSFFYRSSFNSEQDISLTLEDGSVLFWDGQTYQLMQKDATHTYADLSFRTSTERLDGGWNFITEFVLEDGGAGECIFRHVFFCKSPPVFGDVPDFANDFLTRRNNQLMLSDYQEHSVFERTISGYNDTREEWVRRWDYEGNLLCEFHVNGYTDCFAELEDGGFLTTVETYPEKSLHVLHCDDRGEILWKIQLRSVESPYLTQLLVLPEGIYGFGEIRQPDRGSDLFVCHLSHEGEVLDQKIFGGSDFDSIDWVQSSPDGFTLWGDTQSRDGDFPLSRNGYPMDFRAELTAALEVQSVVEEEHDLFSGDLRGYLDGEPVFFRDELVQVSQEDQLPNENLHSTAIFACGEGYAVVRSLAHGNYPFSDPYMSYAPNYRQLIITGYAQNGTPLWQTVSEPFIS